MLSFIYISNRLTLIYYPSYLEKKKKATNVIETSNIMPTSGCVTGLGVGVKRGVKHKFLLNGSVFGECY